MEYTWLVLAIIFIVAEIASFQLISIWFAIGAIGAMITRFAGGNLTLQCTVFVLVSLVSLLATRPFISKIKKKIVPTNLDMIIGSNAVVLEEINSLKNTGQVKVNGNLWTARSTDDSVIEKDSRVKIERIEGVKLLVTKVN